MPLYEYSCRTCGETIEVLQRLGQPDPELCGEDCSHEGAEAGRGQLAPRQFSVPGGYAMGRGAAPPPPARCEGCPGEGACGVDN